MFIVYTYIGTTMIILRVPKRLRTNTAVGPRFLNDDAIVYILGQLLVQTISNLM